MMKNSVSSWMYLNFLKIQETKNFKQMKNFYIEPSKESPSVIIDEEMHIVEIAGNSTFKNPSRFYQNLVKWIKAFNMGNSKTEVINIHLTEMNKTSAKWILFTIRNLEKIPGLTSNLEINWYYNSNRILSIGQWYSDMVDIPMNFIAA